MNENEKKILEHLITILNNNEITCNTDLVVNNYIDLFTINLILKYINREFGVKINELDATIERFSTVRKISDLLRIYLMGFKKIGFDVRIDDLARITRPELIEIGNHVSIDMCTYISVPAIIGDYIHIAPQVSIIGGATSQLVMENFSAIATGCRIVCASDNFNEGFCCPFIPMKYRKVINKPITLEKFAIVGVNSVVLPGVNLAIGSVLGANSLLIKDTEPWTIYAGSPAIPIKKRNKELLLIGAKELGYEV